MIGKTLVHSLIFGNIYPFLALRVNSFKSQDVFFVSLFQTPFIFTQVSKNVYSQNELKMEKSSNKKVCIERYSEFKCLIQ